MQHDCSRILFVLLVWTITIGLSQVEGLGQDFVPARVAPWTTSRVKGSPDPALPFKATRVFPKVQLNLPTDVSWVPSANRWVATQSRGRLVTFVNDPENAMIEPFLDLSDAFGRPVSNAFAVLFHPDQENQPWCFVTVMVKPRDPNGVKLARFKVTDASTPSVDPGSMQVLASWSSVDHMGGTLQFGPDGMLYFGVGDGQRPYPPDAKNTGQDLSDLQASIMRIDVNDPTDDEPYRIPSDNPFVGQANVREEVWAFGFRNPWKISFDPNSGDLLAADVGWEMREMIYRVEKGRNYGWSIMEGSQPVKQELQPRGSITPPLFEHTHVDSRSISGGHFWQSDRIPELKGAYIYGDWMTGKVWALKHDGDRVLWQKELVDTPFQVIGFMLGPTGDVMILNYDGSILRLDPNLESTEVQPFPTRLSDTGIFQNVEKQQPADGVVEYKISAPHWADGTYSRQWIAVPEDAQLGLYDKDNWMTGDTAGRFRFPANTVLAKTVSYIANQQDRSSERRLETQLLHRHADDWRAYNYVWNDEQTDAILQDDVATERKLTIKDSRVAGGERHQTWRHSSRSECLLCHIWAAGSAHAFWPDQLNIEVDKENQLQRLTSLGMFARKIPANPPIASPYDQAAPLEARARSYLAMNCSTCHRKQGGGTANFNFDLTNSLEQNQFLDAIPAQGSFGIDGARVVASGDPLRSVLIYRTLKSGRGHMPQFGSNVIDMDGIRLLHDWIASLPADTAVANQSKLIHSQINDLIREWDAKRDVSNQMQSLLSTTPGAMALSLACGDNTIDGELKALVVRLGAADERPEIRDLFEHYLPEDQRVKRLGPTIDVDALLARAGDAARGRKLFEDAKEINCRLCHRVGTIGQAIGPDLSGIGARRKPDEILTSIIDPSKEIAPEFRTRQIITFDGQVFSGIVVREDPTEISIADATGKIVTIAGDEVEEMRTIAKSAMPDQLLTGMTAQQAADLLAFLSIQRKTLPPKDRGWNANDRAEDE